jgi:hypothetical protein
VVRRKGLVGSVEEQRSTCLREESFESAARKGLLLVVVEF